MSRCPKCNHYNTLMHCKECNAVWCKDCVKNEGFKIINKCPNCGSHKIETKR